MAEDDILFSLIIPIYNVEQYLTACIQSCLDQNIENYEIICINDGSTDTSGKILDNFSSNERISIFHQENRGLGESRNIGVLHSSGKYVLFIDSDDYIEKNSLFSLIEIIKRFEPDVINFCGNVIQSGQIKKIIPGYNQTLKTPLNGIDYLEKVKPFVGVAWMRAWKKEFLIRNKIKNFSTVPGEDSELAWSIIKAKKVINSDEIIYNYRIRPESITYRDHNTNYINNFLKNRIYFLETLIDNATNKIVKKVIAEELTLASLNLFLKTYKSSKVSTKKKRAIFYKCFKIWFKYPFHFIHILIRKIKR